MLNEMLRRDDARNFIPFSIEFVTCNLKDQTGGEKIFFDKAVFVGGPSEKSKANHFENYTRNIRYATGDRIIKVHVDLITKFNGKKISL